MKNNTKTALIFNDSVFYRNLITKDEVKKLTSVLESPDSAVMAQAYDESDGEGKQLRLTLWNHPGSDITGMINRSEKVVNTCKEVSCYGENDLNEQASKQLKLFSN